LILEYLTHRNKVFTLIHYLNVVNLLLKKLPKQI
jgi:hypothetical protein